jgi:eukaryotic-like serine/threonine-protein kinase
MPLTEGTRLGPYEVGARIGAGGMGEVYSARDTRLDRTVAIKVSHAQFSDRFSREARAAAMLNHPHICSIYDVGPDYIVMEFVDGWPLAGPLPLDEALRYATQIAAALAAAHHKGIVHRDLKPANVLVTKAGVKLLDFGLAKLGAAVATASEQTVTTEQTIVGTLQYMAPEQLRGGEVDGRADIFAFGAVLYEMLTGRRAFGGSDSASLIAAILTAEPARAGLPAGAIPPPVDRILRGCLAKDPAERWQCADDLGRAIALVAPDTGAPDTITAVAAPPRRRNWIATAATVLVAAALLPVAVIHWRETPPAAEVTRFSVGAPSGDSLINGGTISPDGRRIVMRVGSRLWLRSFDQPEAHVLAGTDGAGYPFWSPDGKWIGFVANAQLKKIDAGGGPPVTLAPVNTNLAGSWGRDGTILIGAVGGGLVRVPAAGGPPVPVTTPAQGESRHLSPEFLPGGRHFLYVAGSENPGGSALYAASVDAPGRTSIMRVESNVSFVGSASDPRRGYLLFLRDHTLLAQPFDASTLHTTGDAFSVVEGVFFNNAVGAALHIGFFSASPNTLIYRRDVPRKVQLTWFDRSGRELQEIGAQAAYLVPVLLPDAQRAIIPIDDSANGITDLWLVDGVRGVTSRLTFDRNRHQNPVVSPDGARVAFNAYRGGVLNLYQTATTGAGGITPLLESNLNCYPTDWSRDGRFLAYYTVGGDTREDVWVLPLEGDRKPFPVVQSAATEAGGRFAPDGKWLAYLSTESGRSEVYVQPFSPGKPASGKWQVSTDGAVGFPSWRADGKEMYYRSQTRMMAVDVSTAGDRFVPGAPRPLFPIREAITGYAASPDGQRFLLGVVAGQQAAPSLTVVLDWMAGFRK